jgi:endoglucanase
MLLSRPMWLHLFLCVILYALASPLSASAQTTRRGMMISGTPDAGSIDALRQTGANLARWQLTIPDAAAADAMTLGQYQQWINIQVARVDALLPIFSQHGIQVVLDLHTPPGGYVTRDGLAIHRLFQAGWAETCFVDVWKVLARRYKGNYSVWGFDILNEPATGGDLHAAKWRALAARTAQAIEAIDGGRRIIIESPYGVLAASASCRKSPCAMRSIVSTCMLRFSSRIRELTATQWA